MTTDNDHEVLKVYCCVCGVRIPDNLDPQIQGLGVMLSDNPAMYEGGEAIWMGHFAVTEPHKFICDACVKRVLMLVGDPRRSL